MYTLVSQQWVATRPLPYSEFTQKDDDVHEQSKHNEPPFGHIRRFSRVMATTVEAQRIRARVTRADLANIAGMSIGALEDVIAARTILSPLCATRMQPLFRRGTRLYPTISVAATQPHAALHPYPRMKSTVGVNRKL